MPQPRRSHQPQSRGGGPPRLSDSQRAIIQHRRNLVWLRREVKRQEAERWRSVLSYYARSQTHR